MATSKQATHKRYASVPKELTEEAVSKKKSAFPRDFDHSGWLDVRTRATKPWKRRFFVLANNFLLCGVTPHATKLEKVIPLEGSNVKTTIRTSNMTFEILHKKKRHSFRAPNNAECAAWTEKIQRASRLKIKDVYQFQEILGQNPDGSTQVWAARHRVRGDDVAIKIISKRKYDPRALQNEVLILKRLDHPNVVKLYDLFETKNSVYLVMEKCLGGELFEQIAAQDGHGFCEKDCITIIHQIAKAVKYMHSMGIVHRDLKPENILCVNMNSIKKIKIADFGISKVVFDPEQRKKEREKAKRTRERARRNRKKNMEKALNSNNNNPNGNDTEMKTMDDNSNNNNNNAASGNNNNANANSNNNTNNSNNQNNQNTNNNNTYDDDNKYDDSIQTNGYNNSQSKSHSNHHNQQQQQQQQQYSNNNNNNNYNNNYNNNNKNRHSHKNGGKSRKSKKKNGFNDPLKKRNGVPSGLGQHNQANGHGSRGHGKHSHDDSWDDYKRGIDYTMNTMCGTISYTAPEILHEMPYDRRVDYWSLGVIMYILLCGYPPFAGESEIEVARAILRDEVELEPEDWEHVSEQGKQLVLGLLEKDPKKRMNCDDIIGHSWIHSAKESASKRQRASLIKTVAKRRIRKMSMGVFEQNSKRLNKMYKSRDDSSSGSRRSLSGSASMGPRHSKTDEELFELHIPSSYGSQNQPNSNLLGS